MCGSKTATFRDIGPHNKTSGFDENLNFCQGMNRMTLRLYGVIFGSLTVAFAFFLFVIPVLRNIAMNPLFSPR